MTKHMLTAVAAIAALTACEGRIGGGEEAGASAEAPAAEGKAEEGRLTIKGPGVDIALNIPRSIRDRAEVDSGNQMIPPGSTLSGLHIQGGDGDGRDRDGSVELRFTSDLPPAELAAWYRDPARAERFSVESATREGDALVIGGIVREGGGRFTVRLSPRGTGTDARLALSDSG